MSEIVKPKPSDALGKLKDLTDKTVKVSTEKPTINQGGTKK